MSAQHTPGPWEVRKGRFHFYVWSKTRLITMVRYLGYTNGWTTEIDARLIAAAPEMFDVLEWAERAISKDHLTDTQVRDNVLIAIRAAIAKATGAVK